MAFGRYRGRQLDEIPPQYLKWLLDNCELTTVMGLAILNLLEENKPSLTTIMPFGKFQGFTVEELPISYLVWALRNIGLDPVTAESMKLVLEQSGLKVPKRKKVADGLPALSNAPDPLKNQRARCIFRGEPPPPLEPPFDTIEGEDEPEFPETPESEGSAGSPEIPF